MRASGSLTRIATGCAAFAVAGMLAGCGGSARQTGGSTAKRPAAAAPAAGGPAPINDAISISSLREQAIGVIEKEAAGGEPQVRANAVEAAIASPARLKGIIDRGLDDPNLGVRSVASAAAGRIKLRAASRRLEALVNDSSPYVRISAIGALARMNLPVDQTPLADALLGDPSPKVRSHAAFTVGEIGNRSAIGLLKDAAAAKLERASPGEVKIMQLQIAEAMVKLGDDSQLQPIRAALYPSRPDELEAAALAVQILGQVRDKAAMGQLMHMASYRDPSGQPLPAEIRLAVASALAKMGDKQGGFIAEEFRADKSAPIRAQAAATYGDIGDGASLARLKELMADPDSLVRVSAAAGVLRAVGRE